MKKILFLFLIVSSINLCGQNQNESFLQRQNQHSISVEYFAASYTYATKFSNNKIFGIRSKIGFAKKFNLIPTTYKFTHYESLQPISPGTIDENPKAITKTANLEFFDDFVDLINIQFFHRLLLSDKLFMDYGLYSNLGFIDKNYGEINDGFIGFGLSAKVFFNLHKFHMGTGLETGYNFLLDSTISKGFFGAYFTPIILGFNF